MTKTVNPFIVVRRAGPSDGPGCREVVTSYTMSLARENFSACMFNEIILYMIVLFWAVFFIFFGIPLLYCSMVIPGVIAFMYFFIYAAYYNKAMELNSEPADCTWVAEVYEPPFQRVNPSLICYDFEDEIYAEENSRFMRKRIVGTISVKRHATMANSGTIRKLAIDPNYSFSKIGEQLTQQLLQHCVQQAMYSIEVGATEFQCDARELCEKFGFSVRQIYTKKLMGFALSMMRVQMELDLSTWEGSKKQ